MSYSRVHRTSTLKIRWIQHGRRPCLLPLALSSASCGSLSLAPVPSVVWRPTRPRGTPRTMLLLNSQMSRQHLRPRLKTRRNSTHSRNSSAERPRCPKRLHLRTKSSRQKQLQLRMGLLPLTYPHLGSKNSRIILLTKIFIPSRCTNPPGHKRYGITKNNSMRMPRVSSTSFKFSLQA